MLDLAALDVAIGLVFLFFVLSLVCSAINETISTALGWRGEELRKGIENLLSGNETVTTAGRELSEHVYRHPLVQGLVKPGSKKWPSYIPARTFVTALLSLGEQPGTAADEIRSIEASIDAIENPQIRNALRGLLQRAEGNAERFQTAAEEWFDDSMARVAGWYRRKVRFWLIAIAAVLVCFLNADTIQVARNLWTDQAVRKAVVAAAEARPAEGSEVPEIRNVAKTVDDLEELEIPLGWSTGDDPTPTTPNPQRLVWPWDDWGWFFPKLLGLLLTTAALTLGAPFWFDVLSKFARLKASGATPPTTNALRKDEAKPGST